MKKLGTTSLKFVSAVTFLLACNGGSAIAALSVESVASSDAMVRRAYTLIQTNSFKPAVVILQNAVQLNPSDLTARRYLAYSLMQLNACEDAEKQLIAISKISKLTAADYYLSGSINVRMGNNDQALTDYKSALKLEPDMPAAKAGIIELFVLASDFQGATFLCADCLKNAKDRSQYDYFHKVAGYIHTHQVAVESQPDYIKPELQGQSIISPNAVTPSGASSGGFMTGGAMTPPAPRDLIPQTITSPLLAPPKIAPIATRAKA